MEEIKNEELLEQKELEEVAGGDASNAPNGSLLRVADIENNAAVFEAYKTQLAKCKAKGLTKGEFLTWAEMQTASSKLGYYVPMETIYPFIKKYWDQV